MGLEDTGAGGADSQWCGRQAGPLRKQRMLQRKSSSGLRRKCPRKRYYRAQCAVLAERRSAGGDCVIRAGAQKTSWLLAAGWSILVGPNFK